VTRKSKDDKAPKHRVEPFKQNLRVLLSDPEVADRASRAAHRVGDLEAKDADAKASAKAYKSEIDAIEAEVKRLSNEVRTRSTYKDVECERVYDLSANEIREIRTDTGEVFFHRAMSDAERQGELGFDAKDDLDDDFGEGGGDAE
jgi:hypothetical protein